MPAKKAIKKASPKAGAVNPVKDSGDALHGLAKEIAGMAEELRPLYHLDTLTDHVGSLASALEHLANATSLSIVATHGSDEDRATVVDYIKGWHEAFRR